MRRISIFSFVGVLLLASQLTAQTISFDSLLDEMIDRDNLARFPSPAYKCSQASSYDRGTVAPDQPGWFANMDRSYFVRIEEADGRKEYVLMDVEGPGAMVRFWATWHGPRGKEFSNGTLRFYLDGSSKPAIEGPIASIIDGGGLCSGPLSEGVSPQTNPAQRGHNLYLPIPYAKSCKVTYETDVLVDEGAHEGEALYYQINYRTYDHGTSVETFDERQMAEQQEKLASVQQRLAKSGLEDDSKLEKISFTGPLPSGKTRTLVIDRPGAIRELTLKLKADNQPQSLRSTVLQLEFDGQPTVWCPVGTFFGRGYKSDPHQTWYTKVTSDGTMHCYWVMPYQKECKLSLVNLSDDSVDVVGGQVSVGRWQWDDRSMYFNGSWRQLTEVSSFKEGATAPGQGAYDVNYVEVAGQGVYVGDTLTIFNGANAWWGEGDEKIYVDGESFPSHVGTGTEDYYGYAWCRPEFFESAFHAQPTGAGNIKAGYSVNSRYRALDAIPFASSIKFDMELWHWSKTIVNYAPAAFWYARPGASCNVEPDPETASKPVAMERSDIIEIVRIKGAIEGEGFEIIEKTGGTTEVQGGSQFDWSNDAQLWWRDGKPGDRLELEFPVKEAGRYEAAASLTKAVDYGIVKISINGKGAREFDRYHTTVQNDKLVLGSFDLKQGSNRMTVEIVGSNDKAVPKHMFGIDYLLLSRKP